LRRCMVLSLASGIVHPPEIGEAAPCHDICLFYAVVVGALRLVACASLSSEDPIVKFSECDFKISIYF
jgi:hypothetical protein